MKSFNGSHQGSWPQAPPVNHSVGWRGTNAGFHANDIEAEFAGLKNMVRERYGRLSFQTTSKNSDTDSIDAGDLYEYACRVNIGSSFEATLKASSGLTCVQSRHNRMAIVCLAFRAIVSNNCSQAYYGR